MAKMKSIMDTVRLRCNINIIEADNGYIVRITGFSEKTVGTIEEACDYIKERMCNYFYD